MRSSPSLAPVASVGEDMRILFFFKASFTPRFAVRTATKFMKCLELTRVEIGVGRMIFSKGTKSQKVTEGMSELETLMTIWRDVADRCTYVFDAERIAGGDAWQDPSETYKLGGGDCEDTSLLLADMLISAGIEARMAIGLVKGGGHAWVAAKADGKEYLLESTIPSLGDGDRPAYVEEDAFDYMPLFLVDRGGIYVKRRNGWTGDYFSSGVWDRFGDETMDGGQNLASGEAMDVARSTELPSNR